MAYFNSWEDLRKQPYYADLSDDELKELWESFKMDPATALRVARNTAHNRQEANKDKAIEDFYQAQDALDRNFNPESYAMRRSGLGKISMPVGGRAGMVNLHRPQYIKDMNQSINADDNILLNKDRLASANSLEAERNESVGWLKGSEQHRAKLEKSIGDYDREIAKLQAEIAMSEAGDPMYDLAVMRMIMDNDMSLMNDIRGRIGKKIDQEFQMKQKKADQEFQHNENELNRENTLDVARMNKEELNASKLEDARADLKKKRNILFYRISQAENDPWNDDGGLVLAAWNDYNDAKKNLGKLGETEDDEMFLSMLKGNFPTTGNVESYIQDVAPKRAEKQRLIAASTNPEIRSDQLMDIYNQLSESGLGSPKELQELGDKYANLKKKENKNAVAKARATEDKNVASWIKSNRAGTQAKIEAKVAEANKKWQHRKFSWKQVNGSTYEVVEVK